MLEDRSPTPEGDGGPLAGLSVVVTGDSIATAMTAKILRGLGMTTARTPLSDSSPLAGTVRDFLLRGVPVVEFDELAEFAADVVLVDEWGASSLPPLDHLVAQGTIVGQITAWGERGPRSGEPASELVVQAAAGLVSLVGRADREPLMLAGNQAAYSAGMQLFTGIMIALHHRDATGEAQVVRTSLLETMATLEWKGATFYQADGNLLSRGQSTGPLILPTSDGHLAFYYRDIDWPAVQSMFDDDRLRDARFDTMKGRIAAERELSGLLATHTLKHTKHDLYHRAQALGIPVGSVETVPDLIADEQYAHQRFLVTPDDGDGAPEPSLPFTFNGRRFSDVSEQSGSAVAGSAR